MMVALVAIIVAFDATLLKERFLARSMFGDVLVLAVTGGVLTLLWWSIDLVAVSGGTRPYNFRVAADEPIRLAVIALALHALAAVIPYLGRRSIDAFWDYNRRLFLRALSSALFSGVLFAGLAVALWAIDELLSIDVESETYTDVFAFIAGIVCTWFFLGGVPSNADKYSSNGEVDDAGELAKSGGSVITSEHATEVSVMADAAYPRGLKVFVQFVLLPLTLVYLVILYLYALRITFQWSLPEGQVSYLIFSYAVVGILAYLLIYPLRVDDENQWIRGFSRGFFIALSPLLVVLFVALLRRINDYGLTEPRYYGVALAAWLTIVVTYFLTRREDIRVIPATLALVAIVTVFGPWGATAVAVNSQINELRELSTLDSLTDPRRESIRSITYFLADRGRLAEAAALRTARPDTIDSQLELARLFGIELEEWRRNQQDMHVAFRAWKSIDARGYSDVIQITDNVSSIKAVSATLGRIEISLRPPGVLYVVADSGTVSIRLDSISRALSRPFDSRRLDDGAPRKTLEYSPSEGEAAPSIDVLGHGVRARLVLNWIAGMKGDDSTATINGLSGVLLLGRHQ